MLRVGHRGAAGHVTGNTLASIAKALTLGVDFVEIDVRATRDGHPVVFHDRRVDGSTDGSGAVIELTLEEMRRLRTADGQPIPTLDEALAVINNRVGLMLDIKSPGIVKRVWASVTGSKFVRPVTYASFLHAELLAVRSFASGAHTMALLDCLPVDPTAFAKDAAVTQVGLGIDCLTGDFVSALHREGLRVFVYTVNEPSDIAWVRSLGVDGIISDFPERINSGGQI
jgi:glycerophosphoryl diester phosphodiesterase